MDAATVVIHGLMWAADAGVFVAAVTQSIEHPADVHSVRRLGHGLIEIGRCQRVEITVQKTGGLNLDEIVALAFAGLCAILAGHLGAQVTVK
ncbi:MAG TPA: hypothetical protein PK384_10955 [Candidatus Latescibacteria bacterium]|nr:hypothetical protein [Candidatus Latescibacterota bacterium]